MSDENVDFLPLDEVHELKRIVDDGNLEVRRLQYSYNLDADDSETASLELARREATRGKWDEETISPYYRQRHYDPNPAQFVSEDPLGFDGGDKNLYGYVGNSPVNYTDPTGLIAEGFLDTLGNKLEGAAYEIAGFVVRNVHEPVGRSLADNYALESALRTGDSIAVGVAQTGNFVGFDIREFREDLYGEEVNDNLNETIVTISTAGTLVLGGFALSGLAAGSAAFNATATAAINTGLINAGIGLTTQLIFNEGNSSNLDYGSLALDFGFGTLGSFVGAGVAAKTGGGLVSRIGFSTAFEGAFAGTEQVVRNLANGGSWSQDVRSAIVQGALSQLGGEIIENAPVGKLLDKFNFVGGSKSARAVNKEIVGGEIVARSDSPSRFNKVTEDGTNLEVFTDANGNRVTRRVEECFVAGTLIATSEGLRAIEDLRVGDKVYSTDEKGIGGAFAVRTLFTRQVDCVYDIKVDGTTITSSGEHPFWVMGCGWKLARELEPGDFLLTRTGLNWPVDGVECRSGDFKVYNFEIEEYHTYYVSELEIFVHNMCGDGVGEVPNTGAIGDPETTIVFRVQGGTPPLASRRHIIIDADGNPRINRTTLNVSLGDPAHAQHFLSRRPGADITSFEIPKWMDDFIESEAIPQANYRSNPLNQGGLAPKVVDPTTPGRSYELPSIWAEWLEEVAIQGSGRVIR